MTEAARDQTRTATTAGARRFDLVVVGTSAGGLPALQRLLEPLPPDFPVPVVIVQHLHPDHRPMIAEILDRGAELPVKEVEEGEIAEPSTVYVAGRGRHLLVEDDLRLVESDADLVRFVRPAVDVLFRSVAENVGDRAIAVVLTGTGSDGAHGVEGVAAAGGTVIVQSQDSADFGGMPQAAAATGHADHVVPLEEIPSLLVRLVTATEESGD